jgi:cytochrome b involved in lipid metabolism
VAAHNTASNCWVYTTSNNSVYNITAYIQGGSHPGGNVITPYCGGNMTTFFTGSIGGHRHTSSARSIAMSTFVGAFQ